MVKKLSVKHRLRKLNKQSVGITAILAILIIFSLLEVTNVTHIFNKTSNTSNPTNQPGNTSFNNPSPNNSSTVSSYKAPAKNTSPNNATGLNLQSPNQSTYVSNHSPASASDKLQSVCVTSPGASCSIKFTMGSLIKHLTTKTADSYGSVYWSWTPSQVGLTQGQWNISASASLNGQTKSASDVIALTIP